MTSAAQTASDSNKGAHDAAINAAANAANDPGVDPRLLEVLVCPVSRSALVYDREANELISRAAGLAFPIRNGVPVMLRDEARDIGAK
ncbi:MAG: Trm112 family protein [Myxococcaceae bacterium]|nr:MAG: Trm112 family protein [Myxococcaceae bacterium]